MEDVKLLDKITRFLSNGDGYGSGDGSGYGYGYGSGSGYGDGSGSGYGDGSGSGYGYGYGSGSGYGDGYGSGYGYGYGSGDGSGSGSGYGDGSGFGDGGLSEINGHTVFLVDSVPTIFTVVHDTVAKGFILGSDLTMNPCFVVKANGLFAHGKTMHEAMEALTDKMFDDMPEEERIAEFIKAHPDKEALYPHEDLFNWHHRLTGSCEMGRKAFMKDNDLQMDGQSTVTRFIELTKNSYNGSVIRNLEKAYEATT